LSIRQPKACRGSRMNVRLSPHEIASIRKAFKEYFPAGDALLLFGSRVDPQKKGGDIDLYVETTLSVEKASRARTNFASTLELALGEQKIDIVLNIINNGSELPIYKLARKGGVCLVDNVELLKSAVEVCNMHETRLREALEHLEHLLPFTEEILKNISYEDFGSLEILTTRFAKLQDVIGAKVFPMILILLQDYKSSNSYIDNLNKLEKLEILPSKQAWSNMRDLRNDLTHEYPDDQEFMSRNLNLCFKYSKELVEYWQVLRQKITDILAKK